MKIKHLSGCENWIFHLHLILQENDYLFDIIIIIIITTTTIMHITIILHFHFARTFLARNFCILFCLIIIISPTNFHYHNAKNEIKINKIKVMIIVHARTHARTHTQSGLLSL